MYLAVDIGGTKTLVACFDGQGQLKNEVKFATPSSYEDWLEHCKAAIAELNCKDFQAGCVAVPGRLDRDKGVALGYGTLKWEEAPIEADVEALANCPIVIENDAKLAGLSEATRIKKGARNVLYVTIGTGISCALITNGRIDPAMADSEGGQVLVDYRGQMKQWEDIASGQAIVKRFGKKASEINDAETWKLIAHDFGLGLIDLIAVIQPDIIIMGGGVSTHFAKFEPYLQKELKKYETPLVPIPPIRQAAHPEEAVIYGCYELIKRRYAHTANKAA